jgi:acyl-ACP thioesterase
VDCFRRLRASALFTLLQTAAIRHTEELGVRRDKTLDRGLPWVVARQHVVVERMPVYDERITLRSWPGEMMRVLFPRYYELTDEAGAVLVRASAVWSLMDARTREMAFPDEYGIEIPGVETGRELPYLVRLPAMEQPNAFAFTVPYSCVDLNGHMNNARCFDLAEDRLPAAKEGDILRDVRVEYTGEAMLDTLLVAEWGEKDGKYYVNAMTDRPCFRMELTYDAAKKDGDA